MEYDARLLFDSHFFGWLKRDKELVEKERVETIRNLMQIKSSSTQHRKTHNVMLDFCFDETVSNFGWDPNNLGGAVKKMQKPPFLLGVQDKITVIIRYGIYLANDPPYKTIIFTSPENESLYRQNNHFKEIKSVDVMSGKRALLLFEQYFADFCRIRRA